MLQPHDLFINFAWEMRFVRPLKGKDNLWATLNEGQEADELTLLFRQWSSFEFLINFFTANLSDLEAYYKISSLATAIQDTIEDACELERMILGVSEDTNLDSMFRPLGEKDIINRELIREKAKNWKRPRHPGWLRVYAIKIDAGLYVITGGAIKLTPAMQDRMHTMKELEKMNQCREYLRAAGVFDEDSFTDYIEEENE